MISTLANMVEGGKTPLLENKQLQDLGYKIVIYPNSALRVMTKAVSDLMVTLKESGSTRSSMNSMFLFDQVNNILDLPKWQELERRYSR